ncbi:MULTISPECIES: YfgG family protein [Erwinia]|uniref:YfgG family protein n=1 Tax=Erwinia TaxID=551 RepID=UPI000907D013|nr:MULTISPECIES: YfgG family protein [Erwinia]
MNSAIPFHRRKKSSRMTRIVLFVSFFLLAGRLIYVLPGAIEHSQQKKQDVSTSVAK